MTVRTEIDTLDEPIGPQTTPAPYAIPFCECNRPIYEHDCCKSCHDNRWYRGTCVDCLVEGKLPPPKKPEPPRHYDFLPPVDLENPAPDKPRAPTFDHGIRPKKKGQRRTEPRTVGKHPPNCHCGYCDPTQPIVRPSSRYVKVDA